MPLTLIAVLGLFALIVMIFLGMNIGFSMMIVGFIGMWIIKGPNSAFGLFRTVPFTSATIYSLIVGPLFIIMGQFAYYSGLAAGLLGAADKWLSKFRGGLAYATIIGCAGFAAICGSNTATSATMGVLAYPEMKKAGYDDRISGSIIAAGGTLGILIPPSSGFIFYGIVSECSIGKLFAAGIIPGIILALIMCFAVWIQIKLNPDKAPATRDYTFKEKVSSLKGCLPILILFLAVIGGMFVGVFSAIEASAIGCLLGFISLIVYKKCTWANIKASIRDGVRTYVTIATIVIGAYVFGYFLAVTRVPMTMANWVAEAGLNRYLVLAGILIIYIVMGCFMDTLAMILLTVPIFLPMLEQLGFDPIWFGVLVVLIMQTGMCTPPVGINCYVAQTVLKIPLQTIFAGIWPMVASIVVAAIVVILFPQLSLWLPSVLY